MRTSHRRHTPDERVGNGGAPLRAVIAFRWSPEFTVFSLRGGPPDSFDGIVDERILASPAGVGIEIEVSYTLPMIADPMRDLATLPQIARAVHAARQRRAGQREPGADRCGALVSTGTGAAHQNAGDSSDMADRRRAVRRRPVARHFCRPMRRAPRCPRSARRGLPVRAAGQPAQPIRYRGVEPGSALPQATDRITIGELLLSRQRTQRARRPALFACCVLLRQLIIMHCGEKKIAWNSRVSISPVSETSSPAL